MAVINGATSAIITHTEDYTAYVSPYFVVQKGKFTKHYFEGSSRVVSKLGEGTFVHKNAGIMAGGIDYIAQSAQVQTAIDQYIRGLQVPPGPPTQHGIYATPEWTGEAYPSIDWSEVSQNQEPPEGWPRPPKFNEPGDVPGPPVQFGEAITNANVKAGFNFIPNGVEEKNLYFYHPDHLGSSSYITDKNGEIIQHTEYMAFGEVLVDEHSVSKTMPYLFNGKELDYETGLYYYGARYYDPKVSIFLNVDPLVEKTMTPYAYVNNNPINLIDPTGMEAEDVDDIRLRDKNGNLIATYHTNKIDRDVYINNIDIKKDINININKFLDASIPDVDVIGVSAGGEFTVGGGANVGIQYAYFLDGKDKGNGAYFYSAQATLGLSVGAGVSIFFGDYIGSSGDPNMTMNDFLGNTQSLNIGVEVVSGSFWWGNNLKSNQPELWDYL